MCHASGVRHAGNVITAGVRWVLVVFLLGQETPQYARRCAEAASLAKAHAQALMREGGDVDAVVESLETLPDTPSPPPTVVRLKDVRLHAGDTGLWAAVRDSPPNSPMRNPDGSPMRHADGSPVMRSQLGWQTDLVLAEALPADGM